MSEKISSGYDDVEAEAERLRQRHTAWSEGLEAAEDVNQRAKDLGDRIAESSDPENEFSYQERLFANGQLQQNDMLHHAKLHYNANLWEARQHYYDNQEAYFDLAKREAEAVTTFYESYFGVCDIYSPEEAKAMADDLRRMRKNPNRKVMIGVMTHPAVLSDDGPRPVEVRDAIREEFPSREEMSGGFIDDPDVFNTVHYADLYGPDGPRKAGEAPDVLKNLELVVQYGGEHLHAIQLDLVWPSSEELKQFKAKYPDIAIILQVGKFSLQEAGNDDQAAIERLREYGDAVDYVLLDMSMGMGKGMEASGLLPMLRTIREQLPDLGLAVAGGLGPESVDLLEPIAREFPDISIDAQGNLKRKDAPRDDRGHLIATYPADLDRSKEYIIKSCVMLDGKLTS
ncbi:MAG TPA: hypothetical protein PJ984_00685 [Candidatus Saccharibacteria bacterium]|nr:hypothetical protein [Candidatus Saccharibacteria bacterium]